MRSLVPAVVAVAFVLAGCGYERIGPAFGKANKEAFALQQPPQATPPPPPSMALDTQEAEVIGEAYVRSLSGKAKEEPEPVLYVAPSQRPAGQKLQPSVPRN